MFNGVFWYCFVKRYQLAQPRTLRILAETIGAAYSASVANTRTKNHSLKDFLFTMFPFALSYGICSAFHYLLPSTRNLYSAHGWKTGIWLDVCGLLSGIAFSSDTIDDLRNALFGERTLTEEEEEAEKEAQNADGGGGGKGGSVATSSSSNDSAENYGPKKSLLSTGDQTSLDFEKLGMQGASHGSDVRRLKSNTNAGDLRERQPRLKFYAGQPSPVCSMVVSHVPKATSILKRSHTIQNCPVGGSHTYVSFDVGETVQSVRGLMNRSRKRREAYESQRIHARDRLKREVKEIDAFTIELLSESGAENYSRFVGDLPRIRRLEREAKERRDKEEEHARMIQAAIKQQREGGENGGEMVGGEVAGLGGEGVVSKKKKDLGPMSLKKKHKLMEKKEKEKRLKRRATMLERKHELEKTMERARNGTDEKKNTKSIDKKIDPDTIFRLLKLHYK